MSKYEGLENILLMLKLLPSGYGEINIKIENNKIVLIEKKEKLKP